jgi:hypothetical protein
MGVGQLYLKELIGYRNGRMSVRNEIVPLLAVAKQMSNTQVGSLTFGFPGPLRSIRRHGEGAMMKPFNQLTATAG